jgi:thymidylate synthase
MYLPIPPQPDCASAWREAVRTVDSQPGHSAYNVIIDVENPLLNATLANPGVAIVDEFLCVSDKSIETVANTIFPTGLYHRYGAPAFFEVFRDNVLKKVRRNERWSGYYFERMIQYPTVSGEPPNQLWNIVNRLRNEDVRALNKFELSLFDPARDVDNSPYGGQCLSFLSFKVQPGTDKTLALTAMYRNHFYIEKLLGNLIGLGRLMDFVAREAGLKVGALTVISTHAEIDQPKRAGKAIGRSEIKAMIDKFDQAASPLAA